MGIIRGITSRIKNRVTGAAAPSDAPSDLVIEDLETGEGDLAAAGCAVGVHYTGWLTNGHEFDSSRPRGAPFFFTLGAGEVIKGWDRGVAGMKIGGKRKLTVPPHLGYGRRGVGDIPANATLIFEVELLQVKAPKKRPGQVR
jgi:FKBP-type peptidyl-prolyl cis-trans isomerase